MCTSWLVIKCTNVVNLVWKLKNEKNFVFSWIFRSFGPSNKSVARKRTKANKGGKGSQNLEILSERTFWMSPINPIIAKNELSDSMSNWFNFDP